MVYVLFVCTVQKVFSFLDIQKVNYVGKTLYPCKCCRSEYVDLPEKHPGNLLTHHRNKSSLFHLLGCCHFALFTTALYKTNHRKTSAFLVAHFAWRTTEL